MLFLSAFIILGTLLLLQGASASIDPAAFQSTPSGLAAPEEQTPSVLAGLFDLFEEEPDGWIAVTDGIDFQSFQTPDPNNVFVARMELSDLDVILDSMIGQGRLSGGTQTVSSMAASYEQVLNAWGGTAWGPRNDVVVAINGDFYDSSGVPIRGQVYSGWYARRHPDFENGSGFVWKNNRIPFIGGCINHPAVDQVITYASGGTEKFQGINIPRGSDELILYTPQYDSSTQTDDSGVEVLVELTRPLLILPLPAMIDGTVRQIDDLQGDSFIPFDHIVLSATGSLRTELLESLQVGDPIGISQELNHFQDDCVTNNPDDWTKAYASIGGSYHFIRGGAIQTFSDPGATTRHPRTAVAFDDDYIYFIVVDGRDPGVSEGMSIAELAQFTLTTLNASEAIAQDGGGSSTMVVDGQVVNTPSDTVPASCVLVFLPMVVSDSTAEGSSVTSNRPISNSQNPCLQNAERPVANGLMMVVLDPKLQSSLYEAGEPIQAVANLSLYLGPGNNYDVLGSVNQGANGVILTHSLAGINATGSYWWKVDFGGLIGWVQEGLIGE